MFDTEECFCCKTSDNDIYMDECCICKKPVCRNCHIDILVERIMISICKDYLNKN